MPDFQKERKIKPLVDILTEHSHADHVTGARQAREIMRLSVLDWIAVARAGQDEPVARIMREVYISERAKGQASVVGASEFVAPEIAALVNGVTSHALDYDDTHFAHIGHPSVAVLPAAIAVAQMNDLDMGAVLDAALIGTELSVRFGVWLGRGHYQSGFHQTATAGAFGATAAATRLLGLTKNQTKNAFALTASRAAGLKAQFGTMAKPYHAGLAAQTGVETALLARAGMTASPQAVDGPQGYGATHAGQANVAAFDQMGTHWLMQDISHKFHACCHGTHAMIEALTTLLPDIADESVSSLTIHTHKRWLNVCNIATPQTGLEVKFSYAHLAAMVVHGFDTADLASFSDAVAFTPALIALAENVRVIEDKSIAETAAKVCLSLHSGAKLSTIFDLKTALEYEARKAKVLRKAGVLLGQAEAEALWLRINQNTAPVSAIFAS